MGGGPILVVGLAGRFCAGKSTIASMLIARGARHIDVDSLGHEARERRQQAILSRFGTTDRKELGRLVFADQTALADLEAIVHPAMVERVGELVAEHRAQATDELPSTLGSRIILINAALLFKLGLHRQCDLVLWIDAPFFLRFWRGLRRDGRGIRATWTLMRRQRGLNPQPMEGIADIYRVCDLGRRFALARVLRILEHHNG
jgi:dephospho-CoA kinase